MKIFKKALAVGMFAMLAIAPFQAVAELGFIVGAATVDDVTTTACTTARGQSVDMFGNGVDMDQVWDLQIEVGSKGSGMWQNVPNLGDVFPTANGGAAVGGVTQVARTTSDGPACYRLRMVTDAGGTGQIQLVTDRDTVTAYDSAVSWRVFDDFHASLLPITTGHGVPGYLVFIGAGANAVLGVIEGQPEGVVTLSSGDSGTDDTDMSVISSGLITNGALVSDGLTVVEFRAHISQITDGRTNLGLIDRIQAATEEEPFQANTNVVVEGNSAAHADSVAFLFDTDDISALWGMASLNANTLGNVADEYSLGVAPVATTYQLFRIEVESTGDAYMYIDGILQGVEPVAVATTAVLIPTVTAGSADDGTGTVTKVNVDYIDFWAARATS